MSEVAINDDDDDGRRRRIRLIILIVLIMVIIIFTFGWFSRKEKERKILEEKEQKQKRLRQVEDRIKVLQPQKEKIERLEKAIIIGIRILIGAILVTLNCFHFFSWKEKCQLGDILNFNWAILMGYSFIAFITYGTIANFVKAMKSKLAHQLRKKHFGSLEELEQLNIERDSLIIEIRKLEEDEKLVG